MVLHLAGRPHPTPPLSWMVTAGCGRVASPMHKNCFVAAIAPVPIPTPGGSERVWLLERSRLAFSATGTPAGNGTAGNAGIRRLARRVPQLLAREDRAGVFCCAPGAISPSCAHLLIWCVDSSSNLGPVAKGGKDCPVLHLFCSSVSYPCTMLGFKARTNAPAICAP
jgi:hypothetical protein